MSTVQINLIRWLLQATSIQAFLTLVSLPILVAWGLPLSYLTPVGTLLFTPMLTAYLWCALAVFFTTLCALPNSFCIKALHYVSDCWLWILGLIKIPWQIGFVCPPYALLACIPISAFALVWFMRNRSLAHTTLALLVLLIAWIIGLRMLPQQHRITVTHENGKSITAVHTHNGITVVDADSCCSSMVDGANWMAYHALPTITQKTGAAHVDHFIVLHPRQRTFEALKTLIEKGIVHDITLPYWKDHIPFNAWKAHKELTTTTRSYGYSLNRCSNNESITIDDALCIVPTTQNHMYGKATYNRYILTA